MLPAQLDAPRTMVFLTVPWSAPELVSREAFNKVVAVLAERYSQLGVMTHVLDEEAPETLQWLRSLTIPGLGGCARGAGSVVWLESGTAVAYETNPGPAGWKHLLDRTLELWSAPLSDSTSGPPSLLPPGSPQQDAAAALEEMTAEAQRLGLYE